MNINAITAAISTEEDFFKAIRSAHHTAARILHNSDFTIPLLGVISFLDLRFKDGLGARLTPQEAARHALDSDFTSRADILEFIAEAFEPLLEEAAAAEAAAARKAELDALIAPALEHDCLWDQFIAASRILEEHQGA